MLNFKNTKFITSAPRLDDAPTWSDVPQSAKIQQENGVWALPEMILLGRSNVGKSSLINALTSIKGLAKTSNTPGKTRLMNFFLVDNQLALVDLPGYGYAKVSKTEQIQWRENFEHYLTHRQAPLMVLQLMDSRHGPQPNDLQMFDWLSEQGLDQGVLLTKIDKLKHQEVNTQHQATAELLGIDPEQILLFSSTDPNARGGSHTLQQFMTQWVAALKSA